MSLQVAEDRYARYHRVRESLRLDVAEDKEKARCLLMLLTDEQWLELKHREDYRRLTESRG